jgi:hypothetical protein
MEKDSLYGLFEKKSEPPLSVPFFFRSPRLKFLKPHDSPVNELVIGHTYLPAKPDDPESVIARDMCHNHIV